MTRAEALAEALAEVTVCTDNIRILCSAAMEEGATSEGGAMSAAAGLMARHVGLLADRIRRACGEADFQSHDEWLYAPETRKALAVLEAPAGRAQRPAK